MSGRAGGLGGLAAGLLALAACAEPTRSGARVLLDRPPEALAAVSAGGALLDARALAAAAAFLFPEETQALVRGLLRAEFARREAQRLGIEIVAPAHAAALAEALSGIQRALPEGEDLEAWARRRYGRPFTEVRAALERQLAENQLYQLVLRADARQSGRLRVHMLATEDAARAQRWARELRLGADPQVLAAESLEKDPRGGASFTLPAYLPEPLGSALRDAAPGTVLGPVQLPGDRLLRVARVLAKLAPEPLPPAAALLEDLRAEPIGPLEARSWFEEMCRRYNASDRLPALQPPGPAFVPIGPP